MKPICKTPKTNNKNSAYIALVEKVYKEPNKPQRYSGTTESMLREFFSKTSRKKHIWKRETFKKLLIHAYNQKCYALLRNYQYVTVLHNISAFGNRFIRDVEGWKNNYFTVEEQISSLLKYCFATYETPEFLERAFYVSQKKYMLWYVQLGKGKSVKDLSGMPIELTNKMAHEFRNAPKNVGVFEALRYAQALGYGATKEVAILIAFTSLSRNHGIPETFMSTVVRFFAKEERLETDEVNQMVDYIIYKYRENNAFSMKGRTFNALMHQTRDWHRTMYINYEIENVLSWKPSGLKPLYLEEEENGRKVVYKTVELCNSIELYEEGLAMQHCVAEYDIECDKGYAAIFSLQKQVEESEPERLATLEIQLPDNALVQAKAKYNQDPCKKAMDLINNWREKSKVKMPTPQPQVAVVHELQRNVFEEPPVNRHDSGENEIVLLVKIIFWILYIIFRMAAQ